MYLAWKQQTLEDLSSTSISQAYDEGFVFTRRGKGAMDQTRSVRVNLDAFEPSSENKRILRKTEELTLETIPLPFSDYSWEIGKLGKDFYETKFGEGTFSANKIKELLTAEDSFNVLYSYSIDGNPVGYVICYENDDMIHYSYPFYDLTNENKNIGMGMMTKAVTKAKEDGKKYIYLGSAQRPTDTYKFQFKGMEWFNQEQWSSDLEFLKSAL